VPQSAEPWAAAAKTAAAVAQHRLWMEAAMQVRAGRVRAQKTSEAHPEAHSMQLTFHTANLFARRLLCWAGACAGGSG
jgi:hypothetical protein